MENQETDKVISVRLTGKEWEFFKKEFERTHPRNVRATTGADIFWMLAKHNGYSKRKINGWDE